MLSNDGYNVRVHVRVCGTSSQEVETSFIVFI